MVTEHDHILLVRLIHQINQLVAGSPILVRDWPDHDEYQVEWERDAALKGTWVSLKRTED